MTFLIFQIIYNVWWCCVAWSAFPPFVSLFLVLNARTRAAKFKFSLSKRERERTARTKKGKNQKRSRVHFWQRKSICREEEVSDTHYLKKNNIFIICYLFSLFVSKQASKRKKNFGGKFKYSNISNISNGEGNWKSFEERRAYSASKSIWYKGSYWYFVSLFYLFYLFIFKIYLFILFYFLIIILKLFILFF